MVQREIEQSLFSLTLMGKGQGVKEIDVILAEKVDITLGVVIDAPKLQP